MAARLVGWEGVGVEPRIMGIGPVPAVRRLLDRCHQARGGMPALGATDATGALVATEGFRVNPAIAAIDTIELNEAFASQVLACLGGLDLPADSERVNPDGGAIALGHPIGATGARILVTLLHGLEARQQRLGIATLCVSGGMGLAALVEREAPGGGELPGGRGAPGRREGASFDGGALIGEAS